MINRVQFDPVRLGSSRKRPRRVRKSFVHWTTGSLILAALMTAVLVAVLAMSGCASTLPPAVTTQIATVDSSCHVVFQHYRTALMQRRDDAADADRDLMGEVESGLDLLRLWAQKHKENP